MSEQLNNPNLEQHARLEAVQEAVDTLGSAFHEDWRVKNQLQEDGTFAERIKVKVEKADGSIGWVNAGKEPDGSTELFRQDIANTPYEDLDPEWKAENRAAAEVVVGVMIDRDGSIDLTDEATRVQVGGIVHDAWLSRNEWAAGGDLDKPFDQLPLDEQAKDISQIEVAQQVFQQ